MKVRVVTAVLGRCGRRPERLIDLLAEVGRAALERVGRKTIDLLVVGSMAAGVLDPTENLVAQVADRLGLEAASGYRVESASASGAAAFHVAATAVHSGLARRGLVLAGEKMTSRSTAEVTAVLARSLAPTEAAAGATMPALAALIAQRYLHRYGLDSEAMNSVTLQARERASTNPNAQFRTPTSSAEIAESPVVAAPLRRLHCSAISDGAAAAVVERGAGPATVWGIGQGFDFLSLVDRTELTSFRATRLAAQRAYEMARCTRKELEFAEVHDAFAPFAFVDLEDLGLCGPGEGASWFREGATAPEGRFPVNPSGGLIGRGHPVGASGLLQIGEVARQLLGEAGPTQLPRRVRAGAAQSIGGMAAHTFVTILGEPRGG